MATVNTTKIDNACHNSRNAFISIDQIIFDANETNSFFSYEIIWSGNIDEQTIESNDSRLLSNLKSGDYSFIIQSTVNMSTIGPYSFSINSPTELIITEVRSKPNICDEDGYILVSVSGGVPPYSYYINDIIYLSSDNTLIVENLPEDTYSISVLDSNFCSVAYPGTINIKNSSFDANINQILPPTLLDNYGFLSLNIIGDGPFSFFFTNMENNESIFIDSYNTSHIVSFDPITKLYAYSFDNILYPSTYNITITNNFNCSTTLENITIPNINTMSVDINIESNNKEKLFSPELTLPVYDTIFVPYLHIQNNTDLWKLIQRLNLKDSIYIKINNNISELLIVRYMLDKYCLDTNKIEILKLGNSSTDWFFYFYIAPGLNPIDEPELLNSKISLIDPKSMQEFPITLGLNTSLKLDTENVSIIKGSFLLPDIGYNQFSSLTRTPSIARDMTNLHISIGDNTGNEDQFDFYAKNTIKSVYKNLYQVNYTTTINFLEYFNVLNQYVDINQTSCNSSHNDYLYIIQINNMLQTINNINNLSDIYIYNLNNVVNDGSINLTIVGNNSFTNRDGSTVDNQYNINYFYLDSQSDDIKILIRNNTPINDLSVRGLLEGYYIVRIKDVYNNIPKVINYSDTQISYDNHFIISKNFLQKYNKSIVDKFLYGDILVYINLAQEGLVPNDLPQQTQTETPETPDSLPYQIISQTNDTTNTSQLLVNTTFNILHYITGPKNYHKTFDKNTLFMNILPGVYTIFADEKQLKDSFLYQTYHRILIEPNTSNNIDINFTSYIDQIFLMEN